jgi:ribonuclease R
VDYEASGERRKFQLYPGRMNSRKRCTYSEVENFHQTGHIDAPEDVKKSLELLYKLYEILKRDRDKRGALDFELPESRVYVDDEGNPTQIVRETRYDSHKLIEEMMIAANVCAAEFLHKHGKDGMYRVHDVPQEKKLIAFMSLAKGHFPRELPRIHELRQGPKSLQQFLRVVRGSPKEEVFNMLALRSMPMAVYSSQLAPHYGLGLKAYTHFTSPIRRYPDLVVHRLIKRALGFVPQDEKRPPTPKNWNLAGAAEQCSLQERAAMDMERKVVEIKKARFIEPFIGDAFTARVTSPARPGLFVRLDAYPVEGLIPMETLPRDRYVFDEVHQSLEGQNPKHRFHIGDNVQVVLTDVNPDAGRVTFELMYDSLKSR